MTDAIELAAIDRGAGTPIALVHGGVFHAAPAWAKQLGPLIDAGYRVIAVDRRGHGRSDAGDTDFVSVHLHADDLRLTLELRDAKRAHLVGVSYGALVCLEFALSWPERVVSMTLLEPPLFTWLSSDPEYQPWFEKFMAIGSKKGEVPLEEWLPEWLGLMDARMAAEISPNSPVWPLVEKQAVLIFNEEAGWQYSPDQLIVQSLDVPTLILNGDRSEPPMQKLGELVAEALPDGEHRYIPGGGHDSHARRPEVFNEYLLSFLSNHPAD